MSLKDKLLVEITTVNPIDGDYFYTDLALPAKTMEVEDALQKARVTENYDDFFDISIINCRYLPKLRDVKIDGVNIRELNAFATRLQSLSDMEITALNGIFNHQYEKGKYEDGIGMEELINLTCGLENVPVICNIKNDEELGEFVVDNDLCPELMEAKEDVLQFVNKKLVGFNHREYEDGEFVNGNYVATAVYTYPKEYFSPDREMNINNSVVFSLDVAKAPEGDEPAEHYETLLLPITLEDANKLARDLGAESIYDLVYYDFKSAIPGIDGEMYDSMKCFDKLNKIAEKYISLSKDERMKLKAVMEREEPETLDDAIIISNNIDKFDYDAFVNYGEKFAYAYLAHHLPENFDMSIFSQIDDNTMNKLGRIILERVGGEITRYGCVSKIDGNLMEMIESEDMIQEQGQEIGGMELG